MQRISIAMSMCCLAAALAGCASAPPPPPEAPAEAAPEAGARSAAPAEEEETCPMLDASATPPTCPPECHLADDGTCRKHRGVIVQEKPGK